MITTFKTKQKILIDPIIQFEDYVYLDVDYITFDGDMYSAQVTYYYVQDKSKVITKKTVPAFTKDEADTIESMIPDISGTVTEHLKQLILTATAYQIGVTGFYGLTSNDWEMTYPPVSYELPE